jgi:phenylalanyl-tRNA synthetase beta chain
MNKIVNQQDFVLAVRPPTYRSDVRQACDAAEDILRIVGYDNIDIPPQMHYTPPADSNLRQEAMAEAACNYMSNNGFNEIMTLSFTRGQYYDGLQTYPAHKLVRIKNPSSSELDTMRQTLLFGGMEAIAHNLNRRQHNLRLYEFGNIYSIASTTGNTQERYHQESRMALWLTGMEHEPNWNCAPAACSFFSIKQAVEGLLRQCSIDLEALPSCAAADIYSDGIGYKLMGQPFLDMGIVQRTLCRRFDIKQDVFYAELKWDIMLEYMTRHKAVYVPLPKYPQVKRDMALLLDADVGFEQLRRTAFKAEKNLLRRITLFDVYQGENIPAGKKSYAISCCLQDAAKTLTDSDIDAIMDNLLSAFAKEHGARLR